MLSNASFGDIMSVKGDPSFDICVGGWKHKSVIIKSCNFHNDKWTPILHEKPGDGFFQYQILKFSGWACPRTPLEGLQIT